MQIKLIIKTIIFTLLMPGVGVILIPYLIINGTSDINYPNLSILNVLVVLLQKNEQTVKLSGLF